MDSGFDFSLFLAIPIVGAGAKIHHILNNLIVLHYEKFTY